MLWRTHGRDRDVPWRCPSARAANRNRAVSDDGVMIQRTTSRSPDRAVSLWPSAVCAPTPTATASDAAIIAFLIGFNLPTSRDRGSFESDHERAVPSIALVARWSSPRRTPQIPIGQHATPRVRAWAAFGRRPLLNAQIPQAGIRNPSPSRSLNRIGSALRSGHAHDPVIVIGRWKAEIIRLSESGRSLAIGLASRSRDPAQCASVLYC